MERSKQKKWDEMTPKEKRKGSIVLLVFVSFIVGIIWVFNYASNEQHSREYNDLSSVAQFYADKVLPQNLKHPDGWEYERQAMNKQDSVTYHFTAVVLAKNGFGVRSRLMYNFVIQYIGTKEDSYATDKNNLPSNWKIVSNELVE